ncbi:2-keto-4-pentenoate hydratase/2-oxohepta-3-ene-1,7-dioic acid hydratase in catechol pathway [Micromonospora palomenae]|uniref:2-keto-4-pentenoate hydratase/2-oxohepta-3-ene-1,7-dioic acid hydratase in catechol pathway n=1 Tax=Micromonospora palomenae TaxID=1461247 RepID=A0A561WW07_9ACTN|nr:fumarylacetoacetate hydrolase family protein [Micromonospora palomenae]TWG28011.1 2-keto-4-pentenoate hydratase/2-oxohepta-3-ene-1,7-dioic acid hydratase in catechol pathway [Micromonospora palomenae]
MRIMRVGPVGRERPVRYDDGHYLDLSPLTADIDATFLAGDGLRRAREATDLPEIDVTGQRIGPPVARPGAILCVGQNYAAHAAESGSVPPELPIVFYKAPNTVVGPYDDVLIPRGSTKTDWEVELAVVIGRRARYLSSPDEALAHVAGYVLSNDVSERDFQLTVSGGQWSKGKSCETFQPLGPWLVTTDEVPDPQALRLRSWVNGEPRQDSTTKDMIFDVAYLVWHLSQYTVLDPGDVINTGTPQGVALSGRFPYLSAGDVMEVEIDGLGRQRSTVRSA